MPDLLVRAIDERLAERIKAYAHERAAALNTCMLELIDKGLRAHEAEKASAAIDLHDMSRHAASEIRTLGGAWSGDEAAAFREAIAAMQKIG
jgi:hypothetical protein